MLARGEVAVPDEVEVSLRVGLIRFIGLMTGVPSGVGKYPRRQMLAASRWSREVSRPGCTLVGSGQPADLGFVRDLPGDSITKLDLSSPIVAESFAAVEHLALGLRNLCVADSGLTDAALVGVARLCRLSYLQTWGKPFHWRRGLGACRSLQSRQPLP
jgi:hypothetical protein